MTDRQRPRRRKGLGAKPPPKPMAPPPPVPKVAAAQASVHETRRAAEQVFAEIQAARARASQTDD